MLPRVLPLFALACGITETKPTPKLGDTGPVVDSGAGVSDSGVVDRDGDGYSADDDCDDGDATVHPDAEEVPYDGIDQDCDGADLDDVDGDGFSAAHDCNDADAEVHPGAQEHCDGTDEDCDGMVDNDATDALTGFLDADGDGYGDPSAPWSACDPLGPSSGTDCDDSDSAVHPGAPEICHNLMDDNCDGYIDEMVAGITHPTIQEAVEAACFDSDTVWVTAGTFSEVIRIARPIVLRGIDGAPATVIDASACLATDCPVVLVESDHVELRGLTLTGGVRPSERGYNGGGVAADGYAGLVVSRCRVTGNSAYSGGGLSLTGGRIEGSEIDSNWALSNGGGVFLDSAHDGDVVVDRSHIHDNSAGYGGGGYQYARNGVEWLNNTVEYNEAVLGGGIFLNGFVPESSGNLISDNTATATVMPGDCAGGGLFDEGGNWDQSSDTVSGNHPDDVCTGG